MHTLSVLSSIEHTIYAILQGPQVYAPAVTQMNTKSFILTDFSQSVMIFSGFLRYTKNKLIPSESVLFSVTNTLCTEKATNFMGTSVAGE